VGEQTRLGEVETLGIRNAVRPPVAGMLIEMLVEDQTPVEFGQPLAIVHSAATNRA
jgi:biotin carboxyl carrier protein